MKPKVREETDRLVNTVDTIDAIDRWRRAVRRPLLGREVLSGKEERLEDRLRVLEVIVDDINQERGVHEFLDQCPRRRVRFVEASPLTAEFEGFILQIA